MLSVYDFSSKIFAESQSEVDALQEEFLAFVREHRAEGRPVTAVKLTEALKSRNSNALVKAHIINHFKI